MRAIDRSLGIVAIAPFGAEENRIRTLLCGADACLPPEVTGLELAAVLQALVRRAVGLDLSEPVAEPPPTTPCRKPGAWPTRAGPSSAPPGAASG
ncbi:hypothetical protein WJ973_08145 [Achromobacter xylosoxidans]